MMPYVSLRAIVLYHQGRWAAPALCEARLRRDLLWRHVAFAGDRVRVLALVLVRAHVHVLFLFLSREYFFGAPAPRSVDKYVRIVHFRCCAPHVRDSATLVVPDSGMARLLPNYMATGETLSAPTAERRTFGHAAVAAAGGHNGK